LPVKYQKLPQSFFKRSTLIVAKELLGKLLVRNYNGNILSGEIVETEAYLWKDDEASHTYKGMTKRNASMFLEGGHAYVFFTYGNHYCMNIVSGNKDEGTGILIRALEPRDGIEIMMKNRNTTDILNLCSGPGKLTQALAINRADDGISLQSNSLYVADDIGHKKQRIVRTARIGISRNADKLYRFVISDNPYISRKVK
jgi:DNA-3-methyladenine glycosylase